MSPKGWCGVSRGLFRISKRGREQAADIKIWVNLLKGNAMKVMRSVSIGIAAAVVGAAFILPRAQAVPGEPQPRANEEVVDVGDPIMTCQGEKRRSKNYDCEHFASEVVSSREINLPPEKVTDEVAGCQPGTQPTISKQISYSKSSTVTVSASAKFDLKILAGAGGIFEKIKEYGPGIGIGVSHSWSTTFGQSETYSVPADYGKISWGVFSQRAAESTVNETVVVRNITIGGNDSYLYTANNFKIVTPIEKETTKFPVGTLAKDQRDFKSVEEFKELCPNGVLPEYLGGEPDPGKPDPGRPNALPCDSFLKVLTAGVDAKAIGSHTGTDLQNRCRNIQEHIQNGGNPAILITELRRAIQKAESDGSVNREYAARLDTEAKAMPGAGS
jgi:hypothetical protein